MSSLITEEYREMQRKLHENPDYGVASVGYAPLVANVIRSVGATELLDYGAGKGRLGQTLPQHIQTPLNVMHYEPAVPEWSQPPQPCAMVACIDVLEHIEPHLLDNVLDDLKRVTSRHGIFTVHTQPAAKVLPDGRNAHLIQQPPQWWLPKFMERFELIAFNRMPMGFWIIVERKRGGNPDYEAEVVEPALLVADVMRKVGGTEVLDYGMGDDCLGEALSEFVETPVRIIPYDLARASQPAAPCAMVVCIDVLEGVGSDRLDGVLDDLARVTERHGVFTVRTNATAESGTRAVPVNLQAAAWWLPKFMARFELLTYNRLPEGFGIVVGRKNPA